MNIGELKKALDEIPDDSVVKICVDTPGGFICPDGCAVDVRQVCDGFDWHMGQVLIIPKYNLKLTDAGFEKWRRGI